MKQILKNIGIIILGIIIGMIVNMGLIIFGGIIFSPSENFEPMNAINWDFKYFIFPFLAHSIGTFSGAFIVSKFSYNNATNSWVVFSFRRTIYGNNITCSNLVYIIRYYFMLYSNGFIRMGN